MMKRLIQFAVVFVFVFAASSALAKLPSDLAQALSTIKKEAISYPDRRGDLNTLQRWIKNGEYRISRSKARSIIQKQRNVRQRKTTGLPSDIKALLKTIDEEATPYPERSRDLSTLKRWLDEGEFRLSRSKAQGIINKQRNVRQAKKGLPADLKAMLATIDREAVNYPERQRDLQTLKRWISNGDFRLSRSKAEGIIQKQRNLKNSKGGAMPQDIQRMLKTIDNEAFAYASRSRDLSTLKRWLGNGEFRLSRSKAQGIIDKQRNLRRSKKAGLPADLKQMLKTIEREATPYPERNRDLRTLKRWISNGEFRLSRSKAQGIIEKQRNLKRSR